MHISLNEMEQKLANEIARARYYYARGQGIPDGKIGHQSNELTDLEGVSGEIAWCKAHNLYPDFVVDGPVLFDATTHGGLRIDVKTTRYPNGKLIAAPHKNDENHISADVYALVVGEFPDYRIAGHAFGHDLFQDHRLTVLVPNGKPVFAMVQDDLSTIEELMQPGASTS